MRTLRLRNHADLRNFVRRSESPAPQAGMEAKVAKILAAVRKGGDKALLGFARRFDGTRLKVSDLRATRPEIQAAYARVDRPFVATLTRARAAITAFQEKLLRASWRRYVRPGV